MSWEVLLQDDFDEEFDQFENAVQDELLAHAKLLQQFGSSLGRLHVDTLKGSVHANMKSSGSMRVAASGVLRSPSMRIERQFSWLPAISRGSEKQFYKRLIAKGDERFDRHLQMLPRFRKKTRRARKEGTQKR